MEKKRRKYGLGVREAFHGLLTTNKKEGEKETYFKNHSQSQSSLR